MIPLPSPPEKLDRPYVIVNCASSADGKIALPDGRQTRISSDDDMEFVHELRNWADAVVVGIGTVLKDDPKLTVKEKYVKGPCHPLRVIIDSCCRTPAGSEVLKEIAPTLIATASDPWPLLEQPDNVEVIECGDGKKVDLTILLDNLWKRGVRRIMVEGGGTVISSFLAECLVDEFMIFIGDMIIGGRDGPTPVMGRGAMEFVNITRLERTGFYPMEKGVRIHYRVK